MTRNTKIALSILLIISGLTVLYLFDPVGTAWMPKCPFYLISGYKCPSCGALRGVHALLHLQLAEAIHYNYMLPALLSLAAAIIVNCLRQGLTRLTVRLTYIYLALYTLWWVTRNILDL